jgi:hypothetical protein
LEKNLEGWRGLNDRRGIRGRRIEREKSMDAEHTVAGGNVRAGGRRNGALAKKTTVLAGKGGIKRRGGRR